MTAPTASPIRKVLVCCDAFKGTLDGRAVGESIVRGFPNKSLAYVNIPLTDGGSGFLDAMVGIMPSLVRHTARVVGPRGVGVEAAFAVHPQKEFCVVEMARASGLPLVPSSMQDPRFTTSFGTGQLLREAAKTGAQRIYLGLGGSSTNDFGIPALQAMGIVRARIGEKWYDQRGPPLTGGLLSHVEAFEYHADAVKEFPPIVLISDVMNVLLGPQGATEVYGPQKGAKTPLIRKELEAGLSHVASWIDTILPDLKIREMRGGGAAGGMAAGFYALAKASWQPGAKSFAEMCDLRRHIAWADVVFTGEGRFDSQTTNHGKTISVVVDMCRELKKPLVVVCGQSKDQHDTDDFVIVPLVPAFPIDDAMHRPEFCIVDAVKGNLARIQNFVDQVSHRSTTIKITSKL